MNSKNRYFSTLDESVHFSICKFSDGYRIFSAFSKMDLMTGRGLFQSDFEKLSDATQDVKNKISALEN